MKSHWICQKKQIQWLWKRYLNRDRYSSTLIPCHSQKRSKTYV